MEGPLKRIQAATRLWNDGFKEDAAVLVFIATAAISRLRYPQGQGHTDRSAFTEFVREQIATITKGATNKPLQFPKTTKLPGVKVTENVPLEDIFYGTWRCVMIHEASWPTEVYLTETRTDSEYSTCIELPPDGRIGLPEEWILGLAFAVENSAEILVPKILRFPVYILLSGFVTDLGSNRYQFEYDKTKVPRVKVRNQQAVPLFTDEIIMQAFKNHYKEADFFVGMLPDNESLRDFIERAISSDRFIFNPEPEKTLLPSYSKEVLLPLVTT